MGFLTSRTHNPFRLHLAPPTSTPPPLPLSNSDAPPPPPQQESPPTQQPPSQPESSSSSSSNTSQSFTQWRFPLPISPVSHHLHSQPQGDTEPVPLKGSTLDKTIRNAQNSARPPPPPPLPLSNDKLEELFHVAELQFSTGSNPDRVKAIYTLERSLVPNPRATVEGGDTVACPTAVMTGVLACLKERVAPKPASKVLLALCLAEVNRSVAVNAGAVGVGGGGTCRLRKFGGREGIGSIGIVMHVGGGGGGGQNARSSGANDGAGYGEDGGEGERIRYKRVGSDIRWRRRRRWIGTTRGGGACSYVGFAW
ncbi:ARM repeat superfamily protein [Abeliophyllum distichum]|uniref:ARM repeat superfamily protein n=1 Tax=Abeliophyllum distichum TaxID=126358 RepID=A0ABD1NS87_9LAMI